MRVDLAAMGYAAEEFAVFGEARSFARGTGRATVRPAGTADYCTRVVVFQPSDPARFAGTAIVEWLNCRDGTDTVPQWLRLHRQIVRSGMAWIGVSAQRMGVEGDARGGGSGHLKAVDPARYAEFHHPGDAFSYDIFRQAAQLLREGGFPLPPPACVLGTGSSQSARYLTTYLNTVEPLDPLFDGFLLTGRHRSAATLEGAPVGRGRVPLRGEIQAPVIVLQAETDVFGRMQSHAVRQPDSARFRLWEIAGAAHADSYIAHVGKIDDGTAGAASLAAAYAAGPSARLGLKAPMNASPGSHYVHHAALRHLEAWVRSGVPPPPGDLLTGSVAAGLSRDRWGVVRGGVRTPWVDCPVQVHSGENGESGVFEGLFGRTAPLPPGALALLYPGGAADYLAQFTAALRRSIAAGFVLEADAPEILGLAAAQFAACSE